VDVSDYLKGEGGETGGSSGPEEPQLKGFHPNIAIKLENDQQENCQETCSHYWGVD
jgi:hypothetical protein